MWTQPGGRVRGCSPSPPMFRSLCRTASNHRNYPYRPRFPRSTRCDLVSIQPAPTVQKLILANFQSPGDLVMLTAAVRDLHQCYPGRFITDVRTDSPALWENNPYLTPLDANDVDVKVLEC